MNIFSTPSFTVTNTTAALPGSAANGAEVLAHDAARGLIFVLGADGVDALRVADGTLAFSVPGSAVQVVGGGAPFPVGTGNSVAVSGDNLAIAFGNATPGSTGVAAVFTMDAAGTSATWRATAEVGVLPDMMTFTADGSQLLVAIEAEPTEGFAIDAPGGMTIIDTATWAPTFYGFDAFDAQADALRAAGVRLSNAIPGSPEANQALPSLDLEPEYITISGDRAFVTLQEANAIGVFNLNPENGPVGWTAVLPLGYKDHSLAGNEIDTSDRDGGYNPREVPIFGMYQPDAIASFVQDGVTYLVTANEGDAREYFGPGDVFNEEVRLKDLVPSSGSTPPDGMPGIDPALLAQLQGRMGDADLGRLVVTRWSGDTNGDGLLDQIHAFGGRSFSIWEVGGTDAAPTLTQRYDSGALLDTIIASQAPDLYDDGRADNKGSEPEMITLGTIDGELYAFVGLERSNANLVFRIDGPTDVVYQGLIRNAGDVAPETSVFIPASGDADPVFVVANEASNTTTAYDITQEGSPFTLQILYGSDAEAGLAASGRADRFAAIVEGLEGTFDNSITLAGGDNYIPGPFAAAGTDPSVLPALRAFYEELLDVAPGSLSSLFGSTAAPVFSVDIAIQNAIGVQASVLGNHEFDLGTNTIADAIGFYLSGGNARNIGAQFPYLSANLDFSGDPALSRLYTEALREASSYATTAADLASSTTRNAQAADKKIAPWTTIVENGEVIGVLGVTTQILATISTVNGVQILDPAGDGGVNNVQELADILQPYVDEMQALGINKIVLLSHLQQYQLELDLAPLLSGVDIIFAAGSNAIFADDQDTLRPGDVADEGFPVYRTGADGNPVAIVSTDNEFAYVARLVVTFDENGILISDPDGAGPVGIGGVDPTVSGAFVTTDETVEAIWGAGADPYAEGTRGGAVRSLTDAVAAVIAAKDGNVLGFTDVFLEGRRGEVRTEETNLGNLTADANLAAARLVDGEVLVSIKNGGGIRAEIGTLQGSPVPEELPPQANPDAGKPTGGVSQLDIENSLRFNNALTVLAVTAENLGRIFEHAVAGSNPGATPGQFPQVGGVSFSFDATQQAQVINSATGEITQVGQRIQNLAIYNEDGSVADVIIQDGALVGDAGRVIKIVTLSFLAGSPSQTILGGDGFPFPLFTIPGSRVDLLNNATLGAGNATFAPAGSEQDALAEYLLERHGDADSAFDQVDAGPQTDLRIQNLAFRADTVGIPFAQVTEDGSTRLEQMVVSPRPTAEFAFAGGAGDETIRLHGTDDIVSGGAGTDVIFGGGGDDRISGNAGDDFLYGEAGDDRLDGGAGNNIMFGGTGNDRYVVRSEGDVVDEQENEGTDLVTSFINYVLVDHVENLNLAGTADLTGTGNALNNRINGNSGNNTLAGGDGDDVLNGQDGNDILMGGEGRDVLQGGAGNDQLFGGAGNDRLTGGEGADELTGGAGRDTFSFDAFNHSTPGAMDSIMDFEQGQDIIRLSLIDLGGDDFEFVGTGAFLGGGQASVRFEIVGADTMVFADNGNGGDAEMAFRMVGNFTLTSGDFLF